ncbi:uncharacterized protein APUU_40793A [Aspergillus puulaauensis]|uniref:Uncharacterized protein n=1 Tax=Aspergillus puulaauensis TaxID=1220207 RepID=A0A7R7XN61_9EURO|nr:uncharacterized protein APUU_40793A [Aspergillus puulaauensis]BCS24349.1 hypothetical protein APUU_40793A [Aspergillus puulaauensis]
MGKIGTKHAWEQEASKLSKIFDALSAGSGRLAHGHTFQAHPLACAAAIAAQGIIKRDNPIELTAQMGQKPQMLLRRAIGSLPLVSPLVGGIRGRGLFWTVEFVLHKKLRAEFELEIDFCGQVVRYSLDMGLNVLGNLGRSGKFQVDYVLVCPPYIVTEGELEDIVSRLRSATVERSQPFVEPGVAKYSNSWLLTSI